MEDQFYPLLLTPALHRRVWGGDRLAKLHAAGESQVTEGLEPIGESWLLDADSVVANGSHAGQTLGALAHRFGSALVGTVPHARYGSRFPLLLKLLDAAQPLSVQVHPADDYALTHEAATGHLGKSEAWYVLEASDGATVLWGVTEPLTPEQMRAAATDGSLPQLMHNVPVARGSVVVNPAGTLHAVGAGILLFEIQQASDLTYRLYDYGRLGADGRPRELHLDKAAAVADLAGAPFEEPRVRPVGNGWERLVESPEFVLDRLLLGAASTVASNDAVTGDVFAGDVFAGDVVTGQVNSTSLETLTVVAGEVTLDIVPPTPRAPSDSLAATNAPFQTLRLGFGQTVLLPAGMRSSYSLTGNGEVLRGAVLKGVEAGVAPGSGDRP